MERTNDEEIHKRINYLLRKGTCMQMERSEDAIRIEWIHVENNRCFYKHWRIKIALESYCEKHAQENWERNWMNLERHTTFQQ